PSIILNLKSTFIKKVLEKRHKRQIANQVPIDNISLKLAEYLELLKAKIFCKVDVSDLTSQDL
ncbi:35417_t:CDS:1, partial [Gigaspora margarita]